MSIENKDKLSEKYFVRPTMDKGMTLFYLWLQLPSGEEIPLPPIVLGHLGTDSKKKTVCIYGHLDVQPASIDDGWDTEPFKLVEKDGETKTLWFQFGVKLRRQYCVAAKKKVI